MGSIIVEEAIHKQTLDFLKALLPKLYVSPDEIMKASEHGIDMKEKLVSACIRELIGKLYNKTEFRFYIDNLVFTKHKIN